MNTDNAHFRTVAFYETSPLLPLILGQYVVKVEMALLDTPFAYFFVWLTRRNIAPMSVAS